jgi:hypothetical protein
MTNVLAHKEWIEMRNNIRRVVQSLEVCWKCQKVSECHKYILGHTVLVWLCQGCLCEMEKAVPERPKTRPRPATSNLPGSWASFR